MLTLSLVVSLLLALLVAICLWADRRAWIKIADECHAIAVGINGAAQRERLAIEREHAALESVAVLMKQLADAERRNRRRARRSGDATTEVPNVAS